MTGCSKKNQQQQQQQQQQNQQQNQQQQHGGEGAADWALKAYGGPNQQQAVSATDNTIAVNTPAPCGAAAPMKGGAVRHHLQQLLNNKMQEMQQQQSLQDGGFMQQLVDLASLLNKDKLSNKDMNQAIAMTGGAGVLENIAVPAILLYLNQRIGKKSSASKKQKSMKLRKSARLSSKSRK
jgi:hypothetical protein